MASRRLDSCLFSFLLLILLFTLSIFISNLRPPPTPYLPIQAGSTSSSTNLTPKIFIVAFYDQEGEIWQNDNPSFDLSTELSIPGLSPLFPSVRCTLDHQICMLVTGEGEINAAVSMTALLFSGAFDLSHTYFILAGMAGINPRIGSVGSVAISRFVVQPSLQYEFDARDKPENFSTGYVPLGSHNSSQYPRTIYGTEVFELNAALRDAAVALARTVPLNDTAASAAYKELYVGDPHDYPIYGNAASPPAVLECDAATSDTFVAGAWLGVAWANYTHVVTNGRGVYCMAAQEDAAVLEALVRADAAGLADFRRALVMRAGSDYDRPPVGMSAAENLWHGYEGYVPALRNLFLTGSKVIEGILDGWDDKFEMGIMAENYVGDVLDTLGGEQDYGPAASETWDYDAAPGHEEPAPPETG